MAAFARWRNESAPDLSQGKLKLAGRRLKSGSLGTGERLRGRAGSLEGPAAKGAGNEIK
ncbi:hypothetical protein SAMN02745168_1483 [Papillibacter cinnamivorans DSM 12816]|uniref:Uncharacterized protein n=1 Tax=Papillibacter cinnamivorans DSM 12816 TaxID=1122930 RepID=A0A1W2A4Q3_9FIRM|nr:hypothetical protein SAMN02745168_1483 [Papillibacter cinnamivorans DSM 12816]